MISTRTTNRTGLRPDSFPFDIGSGQWKIVEDAVQQRIEAVELFLADLSGRFRFVGQLNPADPAIDLISRYRRQLSFALPSFQKRIWLASMDLVMDTAAKLRFVDDHYCCPQGLHRFNQCADELGNCTSTQISWRQFTQDARSLIPVDHDGSSVVLGSPTFNTAYADNRFFAEWLDLPYISQRQLELSPTGLMRHANGAAAARITNVFRRLQDDDLDPNCFDANSLQGVRGLVKAANRGTVTVLNAAGAGLFNDRTISRLIPDMIRFFLGREPILPTVKTDSLEDRHTNSIDVVQNYVFRTSSSMDVLKPLVGRASLRDSREQYLQKAAQDPSRFVARQTIASLTEGRAEAVYSFRVFSAGKSRRVLLRGGLKRSCHADGTPIGPVSQDSDARALLVEPAT